MSASWQVIGGVICCVLIFAGIRHEARRARACDLHGHQTPNRTPAAPVLTPAEQAAIAVLATRYAHADPRAGRALADYLRKRAPGISDTDLMRCVLALTVAARWFNRQHANAGDALAAYLHACAGAALELSELERQDIPR